MVLPSTPSPSVSYLSLSFALFHNKMRLEMDLQSAGLQAKPHSYNHGAINSGMARTINSKKGKQVLGTAWARSITDNYTHGLACLCRSLCILCLQQARVVVFTIMARSMLNRSMWDNLMNLLHSQCWCTLFLCLDLTHSVKRNHNFMHENLVSRFMSVSLAGNVWTSTG